jgi:hypothetical protein
VDTTTVNKWGAATTADSTATITNDATITFPTATADWATGAYMTHLVLYDAATAGNFLGFGELPEAKPVLNNDTASFGVGTLTATITSA